MKALALLTLLSISCAAGPDTRKHVTAISLDTLRSSLVAITTYCSDGEKHRGTGWIAGEHRVMTASHVALCGTSSVSAYLIEVVGTESVYFSNAARIGKVDAAYLYVEPVIKEPALRLSRMQPGPGEIVCVMAVVPEEQILCGAVEKPRKGRGWAGVGSYQYHIQTPKGSSGSAIVNKFGQVVGVHVGGNDTRGYGIGYYVSTWKYLLN